MPAKAAIQGFCRCVVYVLDSCFRRNDRCWFLCQNISQCTIRIGVDSDWHPFLDKCDLILKIGKGYEENGETEKFGYIYH